MQAMGEVENEIEYVDLVDSDGVIQKRNVARSDADTYEDLHLQIVIVVVTNALKEILSTQRSLKKNVDPGAYDHICETIQSGEDYVTAAKRGALEEAGVNIYDLSGPLRGVNEYGRYCYLLSARTDEDPHVVNPNEVAWVGFLSLEELHEKHKAGKGFVKGFFTGTTTALEL